MIKCAAINILKFLDAGYFLYCEKEPDLVEKQRASNAVQINYTISVGEVLTESESFISGTRRIWI